MASTKRESERPSPENQKRAKNNDDLSNWLKVVSEYVGETQLDYLNLEDKGLGKEEVKAVLSFLPNSHVTELKLACICLKNCMADLAPLLTKTKIKKLNVIKCELTKDDVLQLAEVLKDTQITDLFMGEENFAERFNFNEVKKFAYHLQKSKLKILAMKHIFVTLFPQTDITSFVQELLNTSVTCVDLSYNECPVNVASLVPSLSHSSVTELNLWFNEQIRGVWEFCEKLGETKIDKLVFYNNRLTDYVFHFLVDGLVGSKVTELTLGSQNFSSLSPILTRLKETLIRKLDVSSNRCVRQNVVHETFVHADCFRYSCLASLSLNGCHLSDKQGEELMESLRFSNVTELNVGQNKFGLLTVKKLAGNINDISLVDLNISSNPLNLEAFFILGGCLKKSKLTRINVSGMFEKANSGDLLSFLKLTEGSPVNQIVMMYFNAWKCSVVGEVEMLVNTKFTALNLTFSDIGDEVISLVTYLKFTSITHLTLLQTKITDDGAVAIADFLRGTQIRKLILCSNLITSRGAKALALALKDSNLLYLNLVANKIEDDGLEFLAKHAKDSFVTELDVAHNPGKRVLLVHKVVLENRIKVQRFVGFFQKITPETNNDEFRFDQNLAEFDVSIFVEKLMEFHKTIIEKPSAITVLLEDKNMSYSKAEIDRLLFEEFPRQFSLFLASKIETDLTELLRILGTADKMGLAALVESLLLHRPIFMIDEEQGILHPLVYRLLLKYKQPVCNIDVEPDGVTRIIEYFTEHADTDGAQDLISLLRDARPS